MNLPDKIDEILENLTSVDSSLPNNRHTQKRHAKLVSEAKAQILELIDQLNKPDDKWNGNFKIPTDDMMEPTQSSREDVNEIWDGNCSLNKAKALKEKWETEAYKTGYIAGYIDQLNKKEEV